MRKHEGDNMALEKQALFGAVDCFLENIRIIVNYEKKHREQFRKSNENSKWSNNFKKKLSIYLLNVFSSHRRISEILRNNKQKNPDFEKYLQFMNWFDRGKSKDENGKEQLHFSWKNIRNKLDHQYPIKIQRGPFPESEKIEKYIEECDADFIVWFEIDKKLFRLNTYIKVDPQIIEMYFKSISDDDFKWVDELDKEIKAQQMKSESKNQ